VVAETGWFGLDPAFSYDGLQMQLSYAKGKTEYTQTPKISAKNQFALEMDHMAECVLENKRPHTPGEEGLQDQKIMEALYQAASTRSPVILPTITTLDTFRGAQPT
jgi:predicted dehydrogenase